jgi:hypothetical protein
MQKSIFWFLMIIVGVAVILGTSSLMWAQTPEIIIDLNFDKTSYAYGEPIGVTVSVMNKSGKDLLLSKGFSALDYYLEMRVIDPAGRLLVARQYGPHDEFPDAPPLASVLHDKKPIRVAPCEVFRAGAKRLAHNDDLRVHYALERPGKYSAQVHVSIMTFNGEPCNVNKYEWLGVLKSETKYFYLEKAEKKKKTSSFPHLERKRNDEGRKISVIHPRSRPVDNRKFATMDSLNFQNTTNKSTPEPLLWHQEQITSSWTTELDGNFFADVVNYNHLNSESFDRNINVHSDSLSMIPLIASSHNPSSTKATGGGSTNPKLPSAEMTVPHSATDVPVDTEIQVDITGVGNNTVVIMEVLGQEVYNTLFPDTAYPHTQKIDDPNDNSKFALIYKDPQADFFNCQQVDVLLKAYNENKPNKIYKPEFGFKTICLTANDNDGDGISNDVEILLGTNPEMKTLFVRPKKIQGFQFVYWEGFIALFPDTRAGFAEIPAFTQAGIEISVIGSPGHPYALMRDFNYAPAQDSSHPPCDILEIIYMPYDAYCAYGHHNYGHTYFYTLGSTWYWDTKGYVPNDQTSAHYQEYHYFTPLIYPFPLANYLSEGAYPRIENTQRPVATSGCGLNQCYNFNYSSPLNMNASYPVTGRPDGTVEFNDIVFDSGTKEIINYPSQGNEYDHDDVQRRTIVHEMGHALLAASEGDHCSDLECIMYHSVVDWNLWDFGPPTDVEKPRTCTHSAGGSKDIRAPGVIHNSVH